MKALHELENKNLIRIVSEPETNYLSLPGDPVSQEEFRQWVKADEKTSTVSLTEAKQKWANQKEGLKILVSMNHRNCSAKAL